MTSKSPNPSDRLADVTEDGLMSSGLPSAGLRDVRRERDKMSQTKHEYGQGATNASPSYGCDAEMQTKFRQMDAGNRPPRKAYR